MNMDQTDPKNEQFDVSARRIARVYAEALLGAAAKNGVEETVLNELDSLVNDLFTDPRLEGLLSMAALGRKARGELFQKIFAHRASGVLSNFLLVLNNHDRLDLVRAILSQLRELYDEKKGRAPVLVTSAVPLSDEQKNRLRADLREKFAFEPILTEKVDSSLLGGLKVRIGDWQFDATVRTRIENLRQQILARSSHEIQSRRDRFSSAV